MRWTHRRRPPERLPTSWKLLAVSVLVVLGSIADAAGGPPYRGRKLVDVLRELQQEGLALIFSSAVVDDSLRIEAEPSSSEPRRLLDEILPPLGLRSEEGPGGAVLVLPAETVELRGEVLSAGGGKPLSEAVVRLHGTPHSATTDDDGKFVIPSVSPGVYSMIVAAPGFGAATFERVAVGGGEAAPLTIELSAHPSFVTEVVVTPNRHSVVREEQSSRRVVTNEETVLAPTMGGDVSRVVELLPGVAAPDHSAAFHVRGSQAQDVSMVLDGLELYDPFHLQSFQSPFSVIDATMVDKIDFFGGGFTADLGDRHGGFVELSTFAPREPTRGELQVGTLNSRFSHRGLAADGAASWMVSARAWYPEALWSTTELGSGEEIDPRLGDLYAKATFALSSRHHISAHGLWVYDRMKFTESGENINESVDARTSNGYAWLRLQSSWSKAVSGETVLSGGRIDRSRNGIAAENAPIVVTDDRFVRFVGIRHDSVWQISPRYALKAGAQLRSLEARYRYVDDNAAAPDEFSAIRLDPHGLSVGLYVAHRTRVTPKLATEVGLRWDRQDYTDDDQLSPRLNAVWRPDERTVMRVAAGRFAQSQRIHELDVEDGETEFGMAELSDQVELSFERGLPGGIGLRVDAYYRELSDLRPRYENLFEPIELFPETTEDRVRIAPDAAKLRGLELLIRGQASRSLFWWGSYTLSAADDVIDGSQVPRSWDQTHAARFLVGYRRPDRWSVSLSGSVHTGWPTTPLIAEEEMQPDGSMEVEAVPGERNSERFPTYVRLDLKARKAFPISHGRLWLTLEVVNLTNRDNPCCLDEAEVVPDGGGYDVEVKYDDWLGFTPSLSLLWEF